MSVTTATRHIDGCGKPASNCSGAPGLALSSRLGDEIGEPVEIMSQFPIK
jgi:hypothetical protein